MRTGLALSVLVTAALALAGCSGGAQDEGGAPVLSEAKELPELHGWVFDPALRPLEGATVKVIDTNSSTLTDGEGGYGLDGLPVEVFLVVVATMEGYIPSSKQITLSPDAPVRLNFTLEPQPVKAATMEVREFDGILGCQVAVMVADQNQFQDCGAGAVQQLDRWEFSIPPDLAGVVVEIHWDAQTPVSESLGARLETLELGKLNTVLGDLVGTSPLRVLVPQSVAEKYYMAGGLMRLTVFAAPNGDESEAGTAASVALQQTFTAYASLFYVEPPDPAYTLGG